MRARIYNRQVAGNHAYYDAEFFHETENGLERDDLTLGGIVFSSSDSHTQIEVWARAAFAGIYPEETLTNITIE
jgi:hypothetical protein